MSEDTQRRQLALTEAQREHKSSTTAYLLWLFLGALGAHRFYVGDKGVAVAQLLTLGGLGVWSLVDVFFIGGRVKSFNKNKDTEFLARA